MKKYYFYLIVTLEVWTQCQQIMHQCNTHFCAVFALVYVCVCCQCFVTFEQEICHQTLGKFDNFAVTKQLQLHLAQFGSLVVLRPAPKDKNTFIVCQEQTFQSIDAASV